LLDIEALGFIVELVDMPTQTADVTTRKSQALAVDASGRQRGRHFVRQLRLADAVRPLENK
jgi:hypothetical protein